MLRKQLTLLSAALAASVLIAGLTPSVQAQDNDKKKGKKDQGKVATKTLVVNLLNPTGVTVHKPTGHVFVASRYGVYRYVPEEKEVYLEIDGYGNDVYGEGPKYEIGPLGVAFLDDQHLIVGDGSRKDPEELVRVYKVGEKPYGENPAEEWRAEDDAEFTLGPIPKSNEKTESGEGNYYGVAVTGGSIFVTANGDDTKGWVAESKVQDGKPGELKLSIATKEATGVDAPVPATVSPDGDLVIGQMGEISKPGDSLLTTYNPKNGELKKQWKTGLSDIAGLAYSPKTGKLYATDFAWLDAAKKKEEEKQGGLYRLDMQDGNVNATRILKLDKPAGLAFGQDGQLYITVFGSKKEGGDDKKKKGGQNDRSPGKLLVISAEAGL